ncbi:uncharacterized protein [Nicotiana tomentosiformis]|uniref:uncharacterized protein n=1 Tax=Nicotiana tomentosiformis TaxID=4098 RepID=UPI00388C814D
MDWLEAQIEVWDQMYDLIPPPPAPERTDEEHRRVLIKTLNEAYVSEKTMVNHLEKMAERFFEVKRITFSDDDLLEEGAGHNRALHLMVKCEGHYVKRVMIDRGSSVDVCPLSTLQQLNIDNNRIRTSNVSIRAFDASLMLRNGYELGKGLGSSLQGIVNPIAPFANKNTFGLGFKPISADIDRAKAHKKNGWNLSKPIPHIAYSFVKPQFEEVQNSSTQDDIDGVCQGLKEMFYEINMVQVGEGPSRASVQLIGPDTSLSNWEATPLPIRKESGFDNAGFKYMTCTRNSCPDLKKLFNLKIMNQEVEYDEDEAFREIKRELDQFENKPKPNLNETQIEVYVDDVIIKLRTQADHVQDLKKFFERLRRFIAQLTTTCEPIFKLLKKNAAIKWIDECREAFDKIKEYLSNPPVLVLPEPGSPLFIYLSVMDSSFGCVLGQHDVTGKREQAIYYLSKKFTIYEAKYTLLERTCCALTWVAQKLRHYLLAYTTYLISRMDPLKYIFQKPMPIGKLAKWQILLTEFDIVYVTRTAMKAQALVDYLAKNSVDDEYESLNTYFLDEEINLVEEVVQDDSQIWKLYFDGAVNIKGVGIGTILVAVVHREQCSRSQNELHRYTADLQRATDERNSLGLFLGQREEEIKDLRAELAKAYRDQNDFYEQINLYIDRSPFLPTCFCFCFPSGEDFIHDI